MGTLSSVGGIMHRIIPVIAVVVSLSLTSCIETHKHYSANLTVTPESITSANPVDLTFEIRDPKGELSRELEIIHEKPMHLFMVSEDLSVYFHEHPQQQSNGTFRLPFTFPNGGKFKIFIDFKPKGDEQTVESFDLEVEGETPDEVELVPDEKYEKTVGSLLVKMKPNAELRKQKDLMLNFQVFDSETKSPVSDLQNYLGAKAHFVIIRKGLGRFVHAHPMTPDEIAEKGKNGGMKMNQSETPDDEKASKITAMTNFPNSGIYKLFAQFKRNDQIITVPFVLEVK